MSKIESLVREFVASLTEAIHEEVQGQVQAELDRAIKTACGTVVGRAPVARSGRRTPREIHAMKERIYKHIKAKPGQRSEQIARDLGIPTKDLVLPFRQLLSAKKITPTGVARGTKYFAE